MPVVPALHVQANKILALERCTEEGQALGPLPAPLHALGFQDPEQRANKILTHEGGTHVSTLTSKLWMILILLYGKFPVRIWIRSHLLKPEVGNVTSKCNGVTRYRFNHVIREITIKGDNISNEHRATAFRSGNEPRKKTIKSNKFSPRC